MDTEQKEMITINSMVRLQINEHQWIGQVVEIREETALVKLMENMHYHATLDELIPLTGSIPERFTDQNAASEKNK